MCYNRIEGVIRMKLARALLLCLLLACVGHGLAETVNGPVFSPLDFLGRAGEARAVLSQDTLDAGGRKSISGLVPSGYRHALIDGQCVYERCHLIGAQLASGTDVYENLITGTAQLNRSDMLPIENRVAAFIRETGESVAYVVRPDFRGTELICRGVEIEADSIESDGLRIRIYLANAQDGIMIDYQTGDFAVSGGGRD